LPVLIRVKILKDRGGLPKSGRDAQQHYQFTDGLVKYLLTEAQDRYFVGSAPRGVDPRVLILEGDLSRTEVNSGGAYLCVLRLKDERTGKFIGQWAGVADNFRLLYGNLFNTDGVAAQGLLGELGSRLVQFLIDNEWPKGATTKPARVIDTGGKLE
jgi:hypothetical protein